MFSLTIVFGPGPMVWTLLFKDRESINSQVNQLEESGIKFVEVADDFSQCAVINKEQLHGWMAEDLEQSRLAHIERALHQARTQAKGAEIADSDPVLKQSRRRSQSEMPMIQPVPGFGPNGGFRG